MGNTPAGAVQAETLEQCVQVAKDVNADPAKPAEARAACYALRESA